MVLGKSWVNEEHALDLAEGWPEQVLLTVLDTCHKAFNQNFLVLINKPSHYKRLQKF
jgi:hypothetical protein